MSGGIFPWNSIKYRITSLPSARRVGLKRVVVGCLWFSCNMPNYCYSSFFTWLVIGGIYLYKIQSYIVTFNFPSFFSCIYSMTLILKDGVKMIQALIFRKYWTEWMQSPLSLMRIAATNASLWVVNMVRSVFSALSASDLSTHNEK